MEAKIVQDLRALARPLASLVPDPRNARTHGDKNLRAIKASLERFGQRKPVVVRRSDMRVLAGNGTLAAARELGWQDLACVMVEDTDPEAVAYGLADNRTAELAEWDEDTLAQLMAELEQAGAADGLGWDQKELEDLLPKAPREPADEGPTEPPAVPVSVQGGVYHLGPHLLVCGDSRVRATWELAGLLPRRAGMVFTSPPYAAQRDYDASSGFEPIRPEDYSAWWEPLQALAGEALAERGSFFVNIKPHVDEGQRSLYVVDLLLAHVRQWGWRFVDELCWQRNTVPGAFPDRFKNGWEPVFHFSKERQITFHPKAVAHASAYAISYDPNAHFGNTAAGYAESNPRQKDENQGPGMALPSNVLQASQDRAGGLGHSAPFPVALPAFFVKAYTDPVDTVVDPFMGSGSTMIACAQEGRRAVGLELSPAYCDVIRKRWTAWARSAGDAIGDGL